MADQHIDEIWRVIPAYPNYEVSDLGRVRRVAGRILKIWTPPPPHRKLPYTRVVLSDRGTRTQKTLLLHRLVAQAFIPNPDNKPCVNHINFDVLDARAVNLEWCTRKENALHSYHAGRWGQFRPQRRGAEHPSAKLTEDDVRKIREMSASGMSDAEVAGMFGVSRWSVSEIRDRKTWKHVV
jgi:hypothetical protein